jgi:hypothetical protein
MREECRQDTPVARSGDNSRTGHVIIDAPVLAGRATFCSRPLLLVDLSACIHLIHLLRQPAMVSARLGKLPMGRSGRWLIDSARCPGPDS